MEGVFLKKKPKILCYVLIFDQVEIIRKSLEFMTRYADRLEIVAIENPSKHSSAIRTIVDGLGERGLISRHYYMDSNITGNAYSVVLEAERGLVEKRKFVLLTDGDLTSQSPQWLDEEVAIMKRHRDVFACGISLDTSNLPVKSFPEAKDWIPPDMNSYDDYNEAYTGGHLLMLRGPELMKFVDWQQEKDLNFVDGELHRYCYEQLHMKWARTKNSIAYHLTWDLYADRDHPYTKFKTKKSFQEMWYHGNTAGFTLKKY